MSLEEEIELKSKEIHTDSYPMSIGELANLYRDEELYLHPEFQREFRWTESQKSRFIESLLLGIPIPSVFVVQKEDGVWDVIDGLQRLSTIFEFMGILKDKNKNIAPGSALCATKFLPSLAGKKWEYQDPELSLTSSQRIDLKRIKIDIKIIKKQSDPDAKFELFQRLNTGGSSLSDQEVRNCLIIMKETRFYDYIKELSGDLNFIESIDVSERLLEEKYDMELVCRYLVYKNCNTADMSSYVDINEFVTDKIIELMDDRTFNRDEEKEIFKKVFDLIKQTNIEKPFAKYDLITKSFKGKFLISAFEAIAAGIGFNVKRYGNNLQLTIADKIKGIWAQEPFTNASGSGSNARTRLPRILPFGRDWFNV